jgi:hypothetical protein
MSERKRFWISWVQDTDDYRPVSYPPNKAVLGWWWSGTTPNGYSLCAVVEANSLEDAVSKVLIDWPEISGDNLRFCDQRGSSYVPSDRFVMEDWMKERFNIPKSLDSSRSRDTIPSGWRVLGKDEERLASDAQWSHGCGEWCLIGDDRVGISNELPKGHAIRQTTNMTELSLIEGFGYVLPGGGRIRVTAKGFEVL